MPAHEGANKDEQAIIARFVPQHTAPTILCFQCGRPMQANGSSRCEECLATHAEIANQIPRRGDITFCKECGRLQNTQGNWHYADRESRELLTQLLKRIHIPPSLRLVDVRFVWTEPHSRRTIIKVTVQGEVEGVMLEQVVPIEFYEHTMLCPICGKAQSAHTWTAQVQIRQHSGAKQAHKKTLLWLEQLILRERAHRTTISIAEGRSGLDFHYASKDDAQKMCDFIVRNVPARFGVSGEHLSDDVQQGTAKFKWNFSVELVPINRDDLVVLPKRLAHSKAGIAQLTVCYRLTNSLYFIDPNTAEIAQVTAAEYWRRPFFSVDSLKSMTQFIVLDIEPLDVAHDKFLLADVTVSPENDFNVQYNIRTHLGAILHAGDTVLGYDLTKAQYNHDDFESLDPSVVPDIVLVKKIYPDRERKRRPRQRMALERADDELNEDELDFLDEMEEEAGIQTSSEEAGVQSYS